MSPKLLQLNIAQLQRAFEKSKANKYSDSRKKIYHECLTQLFTKILSRDIGSYDYSAQIRLKKVLDFIFYSIEFLDSSTLTNIPYEIVFCLEKALNEWDNSKSYIVVTSLQNNFLSYSFNPILALTQDYYDIIQNDFNIAFNYKLIQINLPRYLVHDYLANVVLYHELGHFIDLKFNISLRLMLTKYGLNPYSNPILRKEFSHIQEYFADIFAAQYIGEASNYYLNYVGHKNPGGDSHPSTDNRIEITNDFLNAISNKTINEIQLATQSTTSFTLEKRYSVISNSDFIDLIPPNFKNDLELHSVFEVGWNLWKIEVDGYIKKSINYIDKYRIINNLIEKSISNYMVIEKWNK